MARSSNIPFNDSLTLNSMTYNDYMQRLKLLAITCFEWHGLPNMIPGRFIEDTLYTYGKIAFFEDSSLGQMVAKVTQAGKLNYYDQPTRFQMYGTGYNAQYDADDCVIIPNNYLEKPTQDTIKLYAYRLYELERTLDTNIKNQKFPILLKGTKEQQLTLQNIYMKYDGNQPVITIDKNLDMNSLAVLNTQAPYVADKLTIYKHDIWNEVLTFLGIANANTDKRERLITDEVQANEEQVQLGAQVMLAARQDAVQQINKRWGLNIRVTQRQQLPGQQEDQEGGTEDGELHDRTADTAAN